MILRVLTSHRQFYQKYWRKQSLYFKISVQIVVLSLVFYHLFIDVNSDLFRDTPDFIKKYGYPVEVHVVESEDGYQTTLHRIPYGRKNDTVGKRPIVFIQHGIMCSSDVWVYSGPETDLPFILADNGYDVWLGNSRGNYYADRHSNKSLTKAQYWDFSWHEMGYYDIPAVIEYILNETEETEIYYIGHSMGSTMFLVMASTRPEYNDKVKFMIALGPVGMLQKFSTVTQNVLVPFYLVLGEVMQVINRYQLLPRTLLRTYLINLVCKDGMPTQFLCKQIAFGLAGESHEQYNASALPVILSHVPAGCSENQVLHFWQTMHKEKFQQRDLGIEGNQRKYNQSEPPEYDLSNIKTPISIYYAENDAIAPVKGVLQLAKSLPNLVGLHAIPLKTFNHFDFTWGLDANRLLYDDIVRELNERTGR